MSDDTGSKSRTVCPDCLWCQEPITRADLARAHRAKLRMPGIHLECAIRNIVGSVGHQLRRCSCFGGTEEDPPGLTRRQAASAALALYRSTQLMSN